MLDKGNFYGRIRRLNSKKKRIVIAVLAIVMLLGVYIKVQAADASSTSINANNATINPVYRPEWTKVSSSYDSENKTLTINIKGSASKNASADVTGTGAGTGEGTGTGEGAGTGTGTGYSVNYDSAVYSTLEASDITVFVDGQEASSITKTLSNATYKDKEGVVITDASKKANDSNNIAYTVEYTITLSGFEEASRQTGKPYKEWSGNVAIQIAGRGADSSTYSANVLKETDYNGVNQSMMELDENGNWVPIKYQDSAIDHNTANTMFADCIRPELTYKASDTTINHGEADADEWVTVIFDAVDKYYKESTFTASDFTIKVDDEDVTSNITKDVYKKEITEEITTNGVTYKTNGDIYYTVNGVSKKIGERYELKISGLDKGDGYTYSGPMQITLASGKIADMSDNTNIDTTTSLWIGKDVPGGSDDDKEIVDVVDPVWKVENISLGSQGTITLIAKDKYYYNSTLTQDKITVYVNGTVSNEIIKSITGPVEVVANKEYRWTIELTNITTATPEYIEFTPTNLTSDGLETGTYKYRKENGGDIKIEIAKDTIIDQYGNKSNAQTFEVGNVDATDPEVYDFRKTYSGTDNTVTFVFNVTDKNYKVPVETADYIEKNEISLFIDEVSESEDINIAALKNNSTLTSKPIKAQMEDGERVIGHQYTLVINNFTETTKQTGKEYLEYSGTVKIKIDENAVKDNNNNTLNPSTTAITQFVDYIKPVIEKIGIQADAEAKTYTMRFKTIDKYITEEPLLTGAIHVYIDGEEASSIDAGASETEKVDKIVKTLSRNEIRKAVNKTVDGVVIKAEDQTTDDKKMIIGYEYTLVLSNFEQAGKQTGKDFIEWSGTVKIVIDEDAIFDEEGITNQKLNDLEKRINYPEAEKTPETPSKITNANDISLRTVNGTHVDFIKPRVEYGQTTLDNTNKTATIVFDVIDKYLYDNQNASNADVTSGTGKNILNLNDLTIKIDGEVVPVNTTSGITATLSTPTKISNTINKTVTNLESGIRELKENETQIVRHQYTLVLSNFEQATRNAKDYKDYSGTITIEIDPDAVKDKPITAPEVTTYSSGGNSLYTNAGETTVKFDAGFVDFIKPDLKYQFNADDISKANNQYTMTFDITDKYYKEGNLTLDDLTILMYNGKTAEGKSPVNLKQKLPSGSITFVGTAKNASNVNYTEEDGTLTINKSSIQIGYTYTLTISNLDQAFIDFDAEDTTANYSGVVTVAIAEGKIKDRGYKGDNTDKNTNTGVTLTSGISIANNATSGNQTVVDTVKPIWTAVSTTAYAEGRTATIEIEGTDTYLKESTLTSNDIEVYVNGSIVTTGITKTLTDPVYETETRYTNNGWNSSTNQAITDTSSTENVRYKVKYTLTLSGYDKYANQVKIKILADKLEDNSGNKNIATEMIVYNVLRVAEAGTSDDKTHVFLNGPTSIQRQYIEQVIFEDGISNAKTAGYITTDAVGNITGITNTAQCWDVSAQGDKSIIAWATNTSAPYTVHIGSKWEIFANINSSLLFKQIGNNSACTATEVIVNLEKLNVASVTNMQYMFRYCGYTSMTTFDLGDNFDTSNVTNMYGMFYEMGYKKLTKLDLSSDTDATEKPNQFNTSKVTNMENMFYEMGVESLTEINIGKNFNTSNVTNMKQMFTRVGANKLTRLDLSSGTEATNTTQFNTSKVTTMRSMFQETCKNKLNTLNLGNNFNTENVTDMYYMFYFIGGYDDGTGKGTIEELNLGSKFDTSKVTTMERMFARVGGSKLKTIKLGDKFKTANVTSMKEMFYCVAETSTTFTGINLGNEFNTGNVANMYKMFCNLGNKSTVFKGLDLGKVFDTSTATNMQEMFSGCGNAGMIYLDLGPYFTKIGSTNSNMFTNAGKSGQLTVFASEAIYKNKNAFKLSNEDTANTLTYTNLTINPIYRPKWELLTNETEVNISNKKLTIKLRGYAYETNSSVEASMGITFGNLASAGININYACNVTSEITDTNKTSYMQIWIDGVEVTSTNNPAKTLAKATLTGVDSGKTEVIHTLELSNFEEATRQSTSGELKKYDEWSGNVSVFVKGRGEGTSTYTANVLKESGYNSVSQNMAQIDQTGTWTDVKFENTTTNKNTEKTMFADFIKPEFTYKWSETTINQGQKKLTVVFDAADRYINLNEEKSKLELSDLKLYVYDLEAGGQYVEFPANLLTAGGNTLTEVALNETRNDTTVQIGWTYTLTINNLEQIYTATGLGDGFTYSGPMSIEIPANKFADKSGNTNVAKSITIGIDDYNNETQHPDHNVAEIVDVVDPVWEVGKDGVQKSTTTDGQLTIKTELLVLDKYFKEKTLTENEIQLKVNNVDVASITGTEINRTLTKKETYNNNEYVLNGITYKIINGNVYRTFTGKDEETENKKVGEIYDFTVSNIKESDASFFEERSKYNDSDTTNGGRVYREYSGNTQIVIPAGKAVDEDGNTNKVTTIELNQVDTLIPEVVKVSGEMNISTTNIENSTYTVVFDIVDKYMSSSDLVTGTDQPKIHVYFDGEEASGITKNITNIETLQATVNSSTQTVGYRYTMVISNIKKERTSTNYAREYLDWSGKLSIKVEENVARDTSNQGNAETIMYGNESATQVKTSASHVDYIRPVVTYQYSSTETGVSDIINKSDKTYKMIFDITDKFYDGVSDLTVSDLTILMSAEQNTEAEASKYYNLSTNNRIGKTLTSTDIYNNVVTTNTSGEQETINMKIGKRYTLTLSNLEQLQRIENNQYLDYSGIVSIIIPENKILDKGRAGDGNNKNGNVATTLTSGINLDGGDVNPDNVKVVDVVAPIWEKTGLTTDIFENKATLDIKGTDKYFYDVNGDAKGTLTLDEIEFLVNGELATGTVEGSTKTFVNTSGETVGKITLSAGTKLYENRIPENEYADGSVGNTYTTESVQYGITYRLEITNIKIDTDQIKVRIKEGSLVDKYENSSKQTDILLFNALRVAKSTSGNWENSATSGFLGNATIARQDIKKIIFKSKNDGFTGAPNLNTMSGSIKTCWDVSANQDTSIRAWITDTIKPYTVYIGSEDDIYANTDSRYLFAYIGYNDTSTYGANESVTVIDGLANLDTRIVINMSYMFSSTGYNKMTSLDLGNNFYTDNVTDMNNMFNKCGYTAMKTFNLGTNFNTGKVTNMTSMFYECGYTAMEALNLGTKFNTGEVTDMNNMFNKCGYTAMKTLDIGDNFDTRKVTNMQYMFRKCGNKKLESLDLSSGTDATNTTQFNTSSVTNMQYMFSEAAQNSLTTFNIGTNFNTSNVTDMQYMFYLVGYSKLETLDLSAGTNATNTTQFNTSKVTNMQYMFHQTGGTLMKTLNLGNNFNTSEVTNMKRMFGLVGGSGFIGLDLGEKFDTRKVINMQEMFYSCGNTTMKYLDLGPLFTNIGSTNSNMFQDTGKSGELTVFAPEAIYKNKNAFKLSNEDTANTLTYTNLTINPIYRPKWELLTNETVVNTTNKKLTIKLRGYAYETNTSVETSMGITSGTLASAGITINYASNVTSKITNSNKATYMKIWIDGVEVTEKNNPAKTLSTETPTGTDSGKTEVIHTLELSNFEESIRQTIPESSSELKKYDEWSGNVSVKIAGREEDTSTYSSDVLKETEYNAKNQNMAQIDQTGTWTDVKFENTTTSKNTEKTMFADFIKPEFTYKWSETEVDQENKTLTVVFDVADRYFDKDNSTGIQLSDFYNPELEEGAEGYYADATTAYNAGKLIFKVDGTPININVTENSLNKVALNETRNGSEVQIGWTYTLVVANLPKTTGDSGQANLYNNYSGPVTIAIPSGKFKDYSGNTNDGKTITIGIDDYNNTTQHPNHNSAEIVDLVDPEIMLTQVAGKNISYLNNSNEINRTDDTIKIRIKATDKYLWKGILEDNANLIKVKVVKPDGAVIENAADSTIDASTRVNVSVTKWSQGTNDIIYDITLSNFGNTQGGLEGLTSIIIPEGMILDKGKNGVLETNIDDEKPNTNVETEIFIGTVTSSGEFTAQNTSIVDFIDPVWKYNTSSITRDRDNETGTVTIQLDGEDSYLFRNYLDTSKITVKVDDEEVSTITKTLSGPTYYKDSDVKTALIKNEEYSSTNNQGSTSTETFKISQANKVKYTLTLGNFGNHEGKVSIVIADNTLKDSSGNGNAETEIDVGNIIWIEEDVEPTPVDTENPKFKAFRQSVVDFIKPKITYSYTEGTNPNIDRTNEKVSITFDAIDTNFLESNIAKESIQIYIDTGTNEKNVTGYLNATEGALELTSTAIPATEVKNGINNIGMRYTLTISKMELENLLEGEIFKRHSGIIKLVIAEGKVWDTSGNKNDETTIIVDTGDGDSLSDGIIVDFIDPIIYYHSKYTNWEDRYALITLRATDRFYNYESNLEPEDLTFYQQKEDGTWLDITNKFYDPSNSINKITISSLNNDYGEDFTIRLDDFEEEFRMKIVISGGSKTTNAEGIVVLDGIYDTSNNVNKETEIIIDLDNRKPYWKYVGTDTNITDFDDDDKTGTISFYVDGLDRFLNVDESVLEKSDIKLLLDGEDITNIDNITVTKIGEDRNYSVDGENGELEDADGMRSVSYRIDITGLTDIGIYSLVIASETLVDDFNNKSSATTISCSRSAIASNTKNYEMITYNTSPDGEQLHHSYVRELMSVNITGTNHEAETYRPSSIGEIFNGGENPLFSAPMYETVVNGYTVSQNYRPKSFAGWAVADENGNTIYYTDSTYTTVSETKTNYTKVYGLYDEIPKTVTNLKAVWQNATVIYVSQSAGNDSNDGTVDNPVKTITRAYELLNPSGTAENNIIVIKDAVEWTSSTTITRPATITSEYAGINYGKTANAELKISADMNVNADITFDEIKLYTTSNKLIANYKNVIIGRGVTTPTNKYTFEKIVGGNYETETTTGNIGINTIRIEVGKYKDVVAGSTLTDSTTTEKMITNIVVIGNMKDTALSVNDKLTIEGKFVVGENETNCYPYGVTSSNGYSQIYSNVTLYSGTINATNTEDIAIYLKSLNGKADGKVLFNMYGGDVNGNIYAGSRTVNTYTGEIINTLNFYGGTIVGDIYGQGLDMVFKGGSRITLAGIVDITGNVFGGSNAKSDSYQGTGNTEIILNSASAKVSQNIYGGSNGIAGNNNDIEGTTNITINLGIVSGNIYGGGNNSGIGIGNSNITINGGSILGNIVGGAYNEQVSGTANITVLGGTIGGNIYGGNQNAESSQLSSDTTFQNAVITIGDTTDDITPTLNGNIYGGGIYEKSDNVSITLNECETTNVSVYGGSNYEATVGQAEITLNGMTVANIYGGGNEKGSVGQADIYLNSGTVTQVYGGGYKAEVSIANINLGKTQTIEGTEVVTGTANVGTIFGGPNSSSAVETVNIILTSGNLDDVFGGGNSANVGTANVTLKSITIDEIHGGSKDGGTTTTTNVNLKSGIVTNVFGGGLNNVTVGTSNIIHEENASVTTIYGGNDTSTENGGTVTNSNIKVSKTVANIYGGNYLKGTTQNSNIIIHGSANVSNKLYGGGYKSAIGTLGADGVGNGIATINIVGGTINCDINGGSEQSVVNGKTYINIGIDTLTDTSTVTSGAINIEGTIFGSGDSELAPNRYSDDKTLYNYDYISVKGSTHIRLDNSTDSPISYSGTIFGSGNGATYSSTGATDTSTVMLKDLGSADDAYELISVERTGTVYIGNSVIELQGRQDINNTYIRKSYSLNRVTNRLVLHNNSTLYTRRGFNMVGGFASLANYNLATGAETKATYSISGTGEVTKNADNRLYTFEGVNLVFATVGTVPTGTSTQDLWGDVNGMAFFGMYAIDRANPNLADNKIHDIYDPNYTADDNATQEFKIGTYVEGRNKASHDINVDGFYTNVKDEDGNVNPEIIGVTNFGKYYDWIINEEVLDYQIDLIASTYGTESSTKLTLGGTENIVKDDGSFATNTEFTLNTVSLNPSNAGMSFIDSLTVPTISENANNTFGLTMKTDTSGWVNSGSVNILGSGDNTNGTFTGDGTFKSDTNGSTGSLIFNIYNSVNITEQKDLGFVNLVLTGKTISNTDGTVSNTFKVVIQINIQTLIEDLKMQYNPSFTDTIETERNYTSDSKVDLTYTFYKTNVTDTIYNSGDYRVLSTSTVLPVGTKITMKDYGQGDSLNKVYYYQVTSSTTYQTEGSRYLYKLSEFLTVDSTTDKYEDSGNYYHSSDDYIFEKYDISIDFRDANITTNQELEETYLELRNSSGNKKYGNGDKTIKYSLYNLIDGDSAKADKTFTISNEHSSYNITDTINIPITINASIVEKLANSNTVHDTENYDKISGIAVEVVDEYDNRVKNPELQGFKINDGSDVYNADESGVIRIPVMESISTISRDYVLSMTQNDVARGQYKVKLYFFTSDDGQHYGNEDKITKEFYITFINSRLGLIAIEADPNSRIISKSTGKNLDEENGVNMDIKIGDPTENTNIRVELYKRNTTFTGVNTNTPSYTGTEYTSVDIQNYLDGISGTKTTYGDGNEYVLIPSGTYEVEVGEKTIEFQKALKSIGSSGISTGEYKLVFRSYQDDVLVQSATKTFIVSE